MEITLEDLRIEQELFSVLDDDPTEYGMQDDSFIQYGVVCRVLDLQGGESSSFNDLLEVFYLYYKE